jgi:general secretion pathway protein J
VRRRPREVARCAGFTLLEVIIALSIVGALLAIAFGGLRMAIGAWSSGEDRAELQQHARGVTQVVGRAVGAAYPYKASSSEGTEKKLLFRGEEHRLELVTQAPAFPSTVSPAFTALVIALEDGGLVIRQRVLPNYDPFTEATVVLRDSTIRGLDFKYLAGAADGTWEDTWDVDGQQKLPAAIKIQFAIVRGDTLVPLPPITVSVRTTGGPS